jgi:hypothetical protein
MTSDAIKMIDGDLDGLLLRPLMWAPQSLVFESLVFELLSLRTRILGHPINRREIERDVCRKLLGRSPGPVSAGSLLRKDFGEDAYTNMKHEHHERWIGFYTEFVKIVRAQCDELSIPLCYVCDGSGMRVTRDGSHYDCYRCKGVGTSDPHAVAVILVPIGP